MDLAQYLVKLLISLGVVLLFLVLVLPFLVRRFFLGVKGFRGNGSFEVRKVVPVSRSVLIVEIEVKGKTLIVCVSERGADVIYREDVAPPDSTPGRGGLGTGEGDTPDRAQGR